MNHQIPKLLLTDSYKLGHFKMIMDGVKNIYSYCEHRTGAKYDYTVHFGLQILLYRYLEGVFVTMDDVKEAELFAKEHFMADGNFNKDMWEYVVNKHGGKLPIKIKSIPEGTKVPISNCLFTVEITDETLKDNGETLLAPITNVMESLLLQTWSGSNIATISSHIKDEMIPLFSETVDTQDQWFIDFMLHDFGFRGITIPEQAIVAAGHLVPFKGTDTLAAIWGGRNYYNTKEMLGFSIPATEHMVMTQKGEIGEFEVIDFLLNKYPEGPISVVADSYDITGFLDQITTRFKDRILNRNGKFIVRPDSKRFDGDTPKDQNLYICNFLAEKFGFYVNDKGFKNLNPKVGGIYGDGLSSEEIVDSLHHLKDNRWAVNNFVYGMGGGLLQKHNRDTQRAAFKCSAMKVEGDWVDVYKKPLDASKSSKRGRLKVIKDEFDTFQTVRENEGVGAPDLLQTVFLNGEMVNPLTFAEVRSNYNNS